MKEEIILISTLKLEDVREVKFLNTSNISESVFHLTVHKIGNKYLDDW